MIFPGEDLRGALAAAGRRLHPLANPLVGYDALGSTNDEAVRLAGLGAAEGTTVIADTQTAGRGRAGRSWFSPPGAGLYVSVILRPLAPASPGSPPALAGWSRLITLAAGVAAADGIRTATGLPATIKWPNDIVVSDGDGPLTVDRRSRKVAGILTEASTAGDGTPHVIVGIGINVTTAAYPRDIAARATSLEAEAGRTIDRAGVLVEVLAALASRYADLRAGRGAAVLTRWCELSPSAKGARVRFLRGGHRIEGTTAGLNDDGALAVRTDGGIDAVMSGELTWD
jgi:BirA family biotin operon repressor/biotin-[acetyl-CoA-carboxylase] ligase